MITDEQIKNAYIQQYERGILKKEVRSYEVSIWTLQDEFITVLKWSDVEQKGRIQEPKMILSDDAVWEFNFSIPMYVRDPYTYKMEENPIWYNTRNGNIMVNMRKIKVIFNKQKENEQVFEFLITNITESHDGDVLICTIKSESLPFHELGRIGYKYVLSYEELEADLVHWQTYGYWIKPDLTHDTTQPKPNVQYWCKKIGLNRYPEYSENIDLKKWYYKIDMNWTTYPYNTKRLSNIVYEEAFVSNWDDDLRGIAVEPLREKERIVDAQESNVYNITQNIAEKFGIFCRYEYKYDEHYHIIERDVIFFNGLIDDINPLSLIYPYSSSAITRELDSTDITTKMYVRPMDDDTTLLGTANITYCTANKTREDYILNFDYLRDTQGINEQQYEAIGVYEREMHRINNILVPLQDEIAAYENEKIDLEAKIKTYTDSLALDAEQIKANSALSLQLTSEYDNPNTSGRYINGYTAAHPAQAMIIENSQGRYCINLASQKKGIVIESLHIYRTYSSLQQTLTNEITNFSVTYDKNGIPEYIYGVQPANNSSLVFLTYEYDPKLYYDTIVRTWEEKYYYDKKALEENQLRLENPAIDEETGEPAEPYGIKTLLERAKAKQESLLAEKAQLIIQFNELMGPALREGYWQPEDYMNYGESHSQSSEFLNTYEDLFTGVDTGTGFIAGWDTNLFDNEQDIYYESGVTQERIAYPCINISTIYTQLTQLLEQYDTVYVMFNNNYVDPPSSESDAFSDIKNIRPFAIGAEALIRFIRTTSENIYPALVLTGAKSMTEDELAFMHGEHSYLSIGILTTNEVGKNVFVNVSKKISLQADTYWQFDGTNVWTYDSYAEKDIINPYFAHECMIVYPRVKFSSLMLKTSEDTLFISYNDTLLSNYEDYYINNRTLQSSDYHPEYLITIKPETMLKLGGVIGQNSDISIHYVLSNASTAIYLDALEIAKENAYPKVSYTVSPNILQPEIIATLYKRLHQLVTINDAQLKLQEVFGYISKLELDLDQPQNDAIEIKNYKNKFEDLFSTIVAQAEEMKRNDNIINGLGSGGYVLGATGLKKTLDKNDSAMINYLAEHFLTSPVMEDYLSQIFTEAASILSDSNKAISTTQALSMENSKILGEFTSEVQANLVPSIFKQANCPTDFKQGDIWIQVEWDATTGSENEVARYVATANADNSLRNSSVGAPYYGWTKTYGGTMAQVAGSGINLDADTGLLDLFGENVSIVGNKSVNIGSVEINIGANGTKAAAGVNIVAAGYDDENFDGVVASFVKIHPTEIKMFGSKIDLLAGTNALGASALRLDGNNGIYIGSSAGIQLFSGSNDMANPGGANVALMPEYLLFGVSSGANTTAVRITDEAFTVAAGATAVNALSDGSSSLTGTTTSALGFQIKKDFMGMAVLKTINSNSVLNAFILNENGLTLGAGVSNVNNLGTSNLSNASGSYIRIGSNQILMNTTGGISMTGTGGISLASGTSTTTISPSTVSLSTTGSSVTIANNGVSINSGTLYVNAGDNFKINSAATGTNNMLYIGNDNSYLSYSLTNGLSIKGNINATTLDVTSGTIGGWSISSNGLYKAVANQGTIYLGTSSDAINVNDEFIVGYDGRVWLKSLMIDNKPVDVSDFNQAVAYGSGAWNGTTFNATFNFFKGKISRTVGISSSVDVTGISGVSPYSGSGVDGAAVGTVRLDLYVSGVKRSEAKEGIKFDASSLYNMAWNYACSLISYTSGATTIRVPASNGFAAKAFEQYDISATYNAGWNAAVAKEVNCYSRTLSPGTGVYITVPASGGGTSSFYVSASSGSSGGNDGGEGTCFIGGSLVQLAKGIVIPIEQLTIGTQLNGYDEETKQIVPTEVRAIQMFKNAKNIAEIHTENNKQLILTKNHTILTEDGWKALDVEGAKLENPDLSIGQLTENDQLINKDGSSTPIISIVERPDLDGSTVYNIDVEPYDTYIVDGLVVHNAQEKNG